ncbi:hypothetical protein BZG36_00820 [Bifiguratus adelaidae]|uniref:NEDD8-activating enzyme E1 regulatory subunit n=1 Tax=Bifiguratus adelaidae TaxID=1938954 RepID=A0A261Y6K4_9FUNG|nr:hypothetical protein BZG36_00820 [Bifiguratus adelaidae]
MDLKTRKYDRQLRLWAANGQAALEQAKVCLVNGTATGTETLKNLILPGIGSFTVLDDQTVTEADLGNNFFFDTESLGTPRAKAAVDLLRELNAEVGSQTVVESPTRTIDDNPSFFHKFNLIITTNLSEDYERKLSKICWESDIPIIFIRSIGYLGYFRVQMPEVTLVETHPDSLIDFRLDRPFPQLLEYASQFDFETSDSMEHGNIPFVVILLRYMDLWKKSHGGGIPKTYAEKQEFKKLIRSGVRFQEEENFEEAESNVMKACTLTKIPREIEQIFQDEKCQNVTSESPNFWLICRAVRDFIEEEGNGLLPLSGTLPDMKSDTKGYVQLQNVYRQKAQQDIAAVRAHLENVLRHLELPPDSVPHVELESFCKHAAYIKVIRYRTLDEEIETNVKADYISQHLQDEEGLLPYYVLIRGADQFQRTEARWPGTGNTWENDAPVLCQRATEVLTRMGVKEASAIVGTERFQNLALEICRYGECELHNTAGLLGGLVAQEAIKLVTKQYIPVNNTVIFDGTRAMSASFEL